MFDFRRFMQSSTQNMFRQICPRQNYLHQFDIRKVISIQLSIFSIGNGIHLPRPIKSSARTNAGANPTGKCQKFKIIINDVEIYAEKKPDFTATTLDEIKDYINTSAV